MIYKVPRIQSVCGHGNVYNIIFRYGLCKSVPCTMLVTAVYTAVASVGTRCCMCLLNLVVEYNTNFNS